MSPRKVIVNLCPTGMVPTKEQNPHLPVTPDEIVATTLDCARLGASVVHIHPRDAQGRPTWRPEAFAAILGPLRDADDSLLLNATTSGRRWPDLDKRTACLDLKGRLRPDLASLTVGSQNFAHEASTNPPEMIMALAQRMLVHGIKPEVEAFEPGMLHAANMMAGKGLLGPGPLYANIFLGSLGTSPFHMATFASFHALLPQDAVWSVAGIGRYQLDANVAGLAFGGHVRVGLEDNLHFDRERTQHASNQTLVARIVGILRSMGLEPATPREARAMLGLP